MPFLDVAVEETGVALRRPSFVGVGLDACSIFGHSGPAMFSMVQPKSGGGHIAPNAVNSVWHETDAAILVT
jgi:hypothetical protein